MRWFCYLFLLFTAAGCSTSARYQAVDTQGFADVVHHWHSRHADDGRARYTAEQIDKIADNLLLYQRTNGGWPVNKDPLRVLTEAEQAREREQKTALDSSLDNRNSYPQVRYLAAVYQQIPAPEYREAARRGLHYLLDAQLANGGWTHSPPRTDGYYGHITLMDEVMTGVLTLLRDINQGHAHFAFLTADERTRVRQAQARGDQLLLRLQIRQQGKPAIWAGQYDANTLAPAGARSFELPGLVTRESADVVRYLMGFTKPTPEVLYAVEHALAWFKSNALHNLRLLEVPAPWVRWDYHAADFDREIHTDPTAPPIWARFYDLTTNVPFFANRDGTRVATLAEVARERRTGYAWYVTAPLTLLEKDYPAWRDGLTR